MNSRRPLSGGVLAVHLLFGLGGCADLNNLAVQLGSSKLLAILQVQKQPMYGTVVLGPDRTGTLNVASVQGEPSACSGRLLFTSTTQGEADVRCNDGTAASLRFSMLTAVKGVAYGASSKGSLALTFGMADGEAKAYLQGPSAALTP